MIKWLYMDTRNARTPVVFVHGLWIHASSWQPWINLFREAGYKPIAPGWPGDSETVQASREHPELIAGKGITEVTAHYANIIRALPSPPIVIGHSFGGLIVQKLLDQGLARAAIALSPAQTKGVFTLSFMQLHSIWPIIKNPLNYNRAVSLTREEFRYAGGNAIGETESNELYEQWSIPAPGKPPLAASFANFNPNAASKVNLSNTTRGPLFLIAATKDQTVPAAIVRSQFNLYKKSTGAVTEFKEYTDRGHSLSIDHGSLEIARDILAWLKEKSL
jgi:non-heme chloroperoxidase